MVDVKNANLADVGGQPIPIETNDKPFEIAPLKIEDMAEIAAEARRLRHLETIDFIKTARTQKFEINPDEKRKIIVDVIRSPFSYGDVLGCFQDPQMAPALFSKYVLEDGKPLGDKIKDWDLGDLMGAIEPIMTRIAPGMEVEDDEDGNPTEPGDPEPLKTFGST